MSPAAVVAVLDPGADLEPRMFPRRPDSAVVELRRSRVGVKALVAFVVAYDQLVVWSSPPGKLPQVVGHSGVRLACVLRRDADSPRRLPVRGAWNR